MFDTICAISTSMGIGAISIVRVTGQEAIDIVSKIFSVDLHNKKSHTIHYGYIKYNGETIDEVLVMLMKGPKTYTKEDIVEINCHGGINSTKKVLEVLLANGCRLAEPGEFTKRAYLNGRINLLEAESVNDLIVAKNDAARILAINNVDGILTKKIRLIREKIAKILANIEVNIDYPEYTDEVEVTNNMMNEYLRDITIELDDLVKGAKNGRIIKEGINVAIIGKPNVGKSSILNTLLDEEKAIVTNIPGTTRDIVEGSISFDGILLNIVDTAGIRDTNDVVEKIGVEKSLSKIDEADLVLIVLNNHEELTKEDMDIINKTKDKPSIIVINKIDLDTKIDLNELKNREIVFTNTLDNNGIDSLKEKISEMFKLEEIKQKDVNYITNARQIAKIKECIKLVKDVKVALNNNETLDIIEIDLKEIWNILGEIIGESYSEELLDQLFSKFCVGK
jgi:tRNA modification GTPase